MQCVKCKSEFKPVRHWQKYCSEKCRMSYYWDRKEAQEEERKPYANPVSWHTPLDVAERNGETGLTGYVTSAPPNVWDVQRRIWELEQRMKLMQKDHDHRIEMDELSKRMERLEQEREKAKGMGAVLDRLFDPQAIYAVLASLNPQKQKKP